MGKASSSLIRNMIACTLGIIILICSSVFDECRSDTIQYEGRFLEEPPDARGRSLAGGGSVYSSGPVSTYYNPAELVSSGTFSAELNYCTLFPSLADNLSLKSVHLSRDFGDWGCYGFSYVRMSYGKHYIRDERVHTYDYSVTLSAAITLDPRNSVGLGVKYVRIKSFPTELGAASSLALDFGVFSKGHFPQATVKIDEPYYPTLRKYCRTERIPGITLGASFTNIGRDISFGNDSYKAPPPRNLRLALGYQILDADYLGLRFTIDALKMLIDNDDSFGTEIDEIKWIFGVEATFLYIIDLRAGRYLDDVGQQRYTSVGIGLGPQWLRFDYSRVLESDLQYNRRSEESSYSLYCNILPYVFSR